MFFRIVYSTRPPLIHQRFIAGRHSCRLYQWQVFALPSEVRIPAFDTCHRLTSSNQSVRSSRVPRGCHPIHRFGRYSQFGPADSLDVAGKIDDVTTAASWLIGVHTWDRYWIGFIYLHINRKKGRSYLEWQTFALLFKVRVICCWTSVHDPIQWQL